jgi:hypothetical protein
MQGACFAQVLIPAPSIASSNNRWLSIQDAPQQHLPRTTSTITVAPLASTFSDTQDPAKLGYYAAGTRRRRVATARNLQTKDLGNTIQSIHIYHPVVPNI